MVPTRDDALLRDGRVIAKGPSIPASHSIRSCASWPTWLTFESGSDAMDLARLVAVDARRGDCARSGARFGATSRQAPPIGPGFRAAGAAQLPPACAAEGAAPRRADPALVHG